MICRNPAAEVSCRCGHSLLATTDHPDYWHGQGLVAPQSTSEGAAKGSLYNRKGQPPRNGRFWENPRLVPIPS